MNNRLALSTAMLLLTGLAILPDATAQRPRREPTPNDTLESTEILPDNRVTFRIYAPQASEVTISGDWIGQGLGTGGNLQQDEQGVWSIMVGPLPADFYSYAFTVDGVKTLDPKNAMIKQGIRGVDNMFFLPGEATGFENNQPVPHGVIRQVWYQSTTLGMQRRMHVYTPPDYDRGSERYPVLYLLHGGGDDDSGWSTIGRAGFIMDNLLAAEQATPMLIVMPNGSLPRAATRPQAAASEASEADIAARRAAARDRFTNELLNDIVPFVEESLRVQADPAGRAIAGLSMGGGQTLRVITRHPSKFAHAAIWSAGLRRNADQFSAENADFFRDADRFKVLSISVGDRDFALEGSRSLAAVFKQNGLRHELHVSGGGHTWINWRHYLHDYIPRLFQAE